MSKYKNKLFIFEPPEDGVHIGEAMLINETEKPKHIKKAQKINLRKNEFEQLVVYLEKQGMIIKNEQLTRLTKLYKKGLKLNVAYSIVKLHKNTYESYLKNPEFSDLQVANILFNLFLAHYATYKKNHEI